MAKKRIEGMEGVFLAGIITGLADVKYGRIYKWSSRVMVTDRTLGKKPLRYATTAKERAKLAKEKFDFQGIIFNSRREVHRAMKLFAERFGNKIYIGRGSAHADITAVLQNVRKK